MHVSVMGIIAGDDAVVGIDGVDKQILPRATVVNGTDYDAGLRIFRDQH